MYVTVTHALFLLPWAGACRDNVILCLMHGPSLWGLVVAVRFDSNKGFFSTKHFFCCENLDKFLFFSLRNVVLVKCRCSKCICIGHIHLKQKGPPNGKRAINPMEKRPFHALNPVPHSTASPLADVQSRWFPRTSVPYPLPAASHKTLPCKTSQ